MATHQRLTLASMWAFEDIGVHEAQRSFEETTAGANCVFEFAKSDDVFVLKGNIDDTVTAAFGKIVSDLIDKEKDKDLLDMPRIRPLITSSLPVIHEGEDDAGIPGANPAVNLLDEDSEEELVFQGLGRSMKTWFSQKGGLGCFHSGFREILAAVATETGTEISVMDNANGILISGKNGDDVEDALAKLTALERPLSLVKNPFVFNMIGPLTNEDHVRFHLRNYSTVNSVALRRILTDFNLSSNVGLSQISVTVLYEFNPDLHNYDLPPNLRDPPQIGTVPGPSRLWTGFTFQEIGKMENFQEIGTVVETDGLHPFNLASGMVHQYLSFEKATQVEGWVEDGLEQGSVEPSSEPNELVLSMPALEPSTSIPQPKKPSGIKARKPVSFPTDRALVKASVTSDGQIVSQSTSQASVKTAPMNAVPPALNKKWTMIYNPESGSCEDAVSGSVVVKDQATINEISGTSLVSTKPQAPENVVRLLPGFDPTKYGRKMPMKTPLNKQQVLVEVLDPSHTITKGNLTVAFDQPALLPQRLTSGGLEKLLVRPEHGDLATGSEQTYSDGEYAQTNSLIVSSRSADIEVSPKTAPSTGDSSEDCHHSSDNGPTDYLSDLATFDETDVQAENSKYVPKPLRPENKEKLLQYLGRVAADETASREIHRSMYHKTGKPIGSSSASELEALREAILRGAGVRQRSTTLPAHPEDLRTEGSQRSGSTACKGRLEKNMEGKIKDIFEGLKPILDAAEFFPGALTLEVQIGLVAIPILPKTYKNGHISLNEWKRVFQPRNGLSALSTTFYNRLTSSGTDIDHILNLKTVKGEKEVCLFTQDCADSSVIYELHLRTKTEQLLIVTIDRNGKYSLATPPQPLGAAHVHFPRNTWDARVVVQGIIQNTVDDDVQQAIQHLVDNMWLHSEDSLLEILMDVPKGGVVAIEKVLLKRSSRHRYLGPDQASTEACEANRDNQAIYLQIMEVQNLIVGTSTKKDQVVRAQNSSMSEMAQIGRLWYEVSIVSAAIETMLQANVDLEVGERTEDWRSEDFLGNDLALLRPDTIRNVDSHSDIPSESSHLRSVAAAIGNAGLGGLFRVATTIIENIDGVGFHNEGLGPRFASAMLPFKGSTLLGASYVFSSTGDTTVPRRGYTFEELQSVGEVDSASQAGETVTDVPGSGGQEETGGFW